MASSSMKMLETAIVDLECRLGLKPGEAINGGGNNNNNNNNNKNKKKQANNNKRKNNKNNKQPAGPSPEELAAQPEICKLLFKVGVITRVWDHPDADKLYCEEIDVGEETPRLIASGLRPHFTLEQMMGQRLLVVANLKAKNLVRFKSHGMVLCAAAQAQTTTTTQAQTQTVETVEIVEFVEPPPSAKPGDVVWFEGLERPLPLAPSQVEKKKIFKNCLEGLKTDADGCATWKGHRFVVGVEHNNNSNNNKNNDNDNYYCRAKTIRDGPMR